MLFVPFLAGVVNAEPVELSYDNGSRSGYFNGEEGNKEAVCFTPEHPCRILSFSFRPRGTGEMEWHVWGDNGAHEPDIENDLIDPVVVNVNNDQNWVEVDLSEYNLTLNPPEDFHIGHHKLGRSPQIWLDNQSTVQQRTHVYGYNDGLRAWLWMIFGGDGGNYLIRATVEYFDELEDEEYTFHNVSEDAGLGSLGNMAWGDYNNDGWEDLLTGGKTLYRNNGDGTFEDVSDDAGIVANNPARSGTWGDFDNDGWLDFYAINSSYDTDDRLYRNNGDGTFEMVNEHYWLIQGRTPSGACGWGDVNNDGFLDLYVANSENWNDGNPIYYRDYFFAYIPEAEVFADITPRDIARNSHYGRSVAWCDFDFDDDMDVYISNYRLHPNYLLVNQGDLEFEDEADDRGVRGNQQMGAYGHTIGSCWGDFDNDGDFDLLVGNFAHPWGLAYQDKVMLCENSGAPDYVFEDIREESGIRYCETVFGPSWGDYDNDGFLDLFISAVYDGRQPFMYRNLGNRTFEITNYVTGFHGRAYNTSGVSWCDYDHDGDLDLAIAGGNGGLFENRSSEGYYFELVLNGTEANNHFAFGSYASVHAGDLHLLRQVEGGSGSEGCQNMMALHYGLGENSHIDSLVIKWLGGETERFYDIEVDQRAVALQGDGLVVLSSPGRPSVEIPKNFEMSAAYPNPFNGQTTIGFSLAATQRVKFAAYDFTGRRITVLADRKFQAGTHSFTWDADNLPSGNYHIQATFDGGIVSRKVTLLK